MDVLNSISEVNLRIIDFANSSVTSNLKLNKQQLLENTLLAIIVRYQNTNNFETSIKELLNIADYETSTLITIQELDEFCIDYFVLVDDWINAIKFKDEEKPNLYRIAIKYNLDKILGPY